MLCHHLEGIGGEIDRWTISVIGTFDEAYQTLRRQNPDPATCNIGGGVRSQACGSQSDDRAAAPTNV